MPFRLYLFLWLLAFTLSSVKAQHLYPENHNFSKQDSLRGSITPERSWWDVTYYHLDIKVEPKTKFISGKNTFQYKVLKDYQIMQIDLQEPLKITKVIQNNDTLKVKKEGAAHFITLKNKQDIGSIQTLDVYYKGHPKEAVNAPWDGGFSWEKDKNGKDFIATSCQGLGASVWWPCKDHMYDEVDSLLISVNVPNNLMNVSNGRLKSVEQYGDSKTYSWFVRNPINNYGVNVNIGDYVKFSEIYEGLKGKLDMNYYVLKDNLDKAKIHFKDAIRMMEAFEHWFGPYPFYEDGYKLVETPFLGMEHQSAISYGNQYKKGYLGQDLSGTRWGLKFDFIIIHESGHEWFANSITYKDIADMWIHESFTAYSESLFLNYHYGKKAASEYIIGTRRSIKNDKPIIGTYNVNKKGSNDMYYKGANMLHTLRQLVNDDEKWRNILINMNTTFYHQTVTTEQIENYLNEATKMNLTAFFNQYLRTIKIPTLEYTIEKKQLKYKWTNVVEGFKMPILSILNNKIQWLYPNTQWKTLKSNDKILNFKIDNNFYVNSKKI